MRWWIIVFWMKRKRIKRRISSLDIVRVDV